MAQLPIRDVNDPRVLRALAHPLRLRILEAVMFHGPVTATEVSELVGESPANCSWHLRQLARYGFVEEAGGGTGRQRPWRAVPQSLRWDDGEAGSVLAQVGDAATEVLLETEYQALRAWLRGRRTEPTEWRESSYLTQSAGWCTPEEMAEIQAEIQSIVTRYTSRFTDPESRPPGSRPVRFIAWGIPTLLHQPTSSIEEEADA